MSTRTFNINTTGLAGEAVEHIRFAFLDFVGDPQFLHSGLGVITWGGEDWLGIGAFCEIESVGEQIGIAPSRVRLSLAAQMSDYVGSAMNENTWGRLCELYLGTWDGVGLTMDPQLEIRGRMGPPEIQMGVSGQRISIVVEDIRAALNRVNGLRASSVDHQVEAIGDTFYSLLPKMLDHKFIFNGQPMGGTAVAPNTQGYDNWGPPSGPILP